MTDDAVLGFLPDRECGECTYCCQYLTIDSEQLQVKPGQLCPNCTRGQGCKIYADRPRICRDFRCGWSRFEHFDESWRPDKSSVIITTISDNISEGFQSHGFELIMVDPKLALSRPALIQFLVDAIDTKIPVTLSLIGPLGHYPAYFFLNLALEKAVKERDQTQFLSIFAEILNTLKNMKTQPIQFKNAKRASD